MQKQIIEVVNDVSKFFFFFVEIIAQLCKKKKKNRGEENKSTNFVNLFFQIFT